MMGCRAIEEASKEGHARKPGRVSLTQVERRREKRVSILVQKGAPLFSAPLLGRHGKILHGTAILPSSCSLFHPQVRQRSKHTRKLRESGSQRTKSWSRSSSDRRRTRRPHRQEGYCRLKVDVAV